jgi:hypothetical protein
MFTFVAKYVDIDNIVCKLMLPVSTSTQSGIAATNVTELQGDNHHHGYTQTHDGKDGGIILRLSNRYANQSLMENA